MLAYDISAGSLFVSAELRSKHAAVPPNRPLLLPVLWDVTEPPQNAAAWSLPSTVCDLAWAPDNAQVATAQVNGSVGLWDVQRQTCSRTLGRLAKPVNAVAGSKHGHAQFVAGSDDGSIQVWDTRARRPAAVLRHTAAPLKSRKSALSMPVLSVACNADASTAWAGTLDGRVWQWDVRSAAEPVHVMAAHTDMVTGLALARDAERVSSLSADGTVRVWDVRPFVPAEAANATERGHPRCAALLKGAVAGAGAHLHRVAWNPQDTQVLAAGDDGCVQVWDVDSGVPLASVPGHAGAVTGIATHAAGSWLATCSVDGSAVLGKLC